MSEHFDTHVVVGGGGIAGLTFALAFARKGFRVVVMEPVLQHEQRLGGEVLQPKGVQALTELRLLDAVFSKGAKALAGFHTWCEEGDACIPYGSTQQGLTIEHAQLRHALMSLAMQEPNIQMVAGRVTGYEEHATGIDVRGTDKSGSITLSAALLVGADGARSRIRAMAGIPCKFSAISHLNILTIPTALLPDTRAAHCFVGHGTIAFAYALNENKARLMVDHCHTVSHSAQEVAEWLPDRNTGGLKAGLCALRDNADIHHYVTALAIVNKPYRGHVALIGDAAGTCHPVTASGMTSAILDARELAQSLAGTWTKTEKALAAYAHRCRWRHASRTVFANATYDIYASEQPECSLLRRAMVFDCEHHQGAFSGASLLSMTRGHPSLLLYVMFRVLLHGLKELYTSSYYMRMYPAWRTRLRIGLDATSAMLRYASALFGDPWRFSMLARKGVGNTLAPHTHR
jgi:2-polyprenyl-6-methoxyphenol hydroxylase-like FAD-dependent oxidoreductase